MILHPQAAPAAGALPASLCAGPRAMQARLFWLACHKALSPDHATSFEGLRTIRATRDFAEAPRLRAQAGRWIETYIGGGYAVLPVAAVVEG